MEFILHGKSVSPKISIGRLMPKDFLLDKD